MDRKEQRIAQLALFSGCRKSDIRWIASTADAVDLPAGTTLCTAGKAPRELIVVMEGEVVADGQTHGAGSFFGHIGLIDQLPQDVAVATATHARVLVMAAPVFQGMLDRCPGVARTLMGDLVTDIRTADQRIASGRKLRVAW